VCRSAQSRVMVELYYTEKYEYDENIIYNLQIFDNIVLFGQILNWILKLNDKVEQLLNTAMFSLIGLSYIVLGYAQENKILRIIAIICGVYLIAWNFFEKNTLL
jgi:hypothetical protein